MNPAKSSNSPQTGADGSHPGTPQGQGQRSVAPPETPEHQAGGRQGAEDELDEGKRLRPKINTNLVRRGSGGIRQERAPDSVRDESRALDSTRAESMDPNFAGSDPCFSSDLDQSETEAKGRSASTNFGRLVGPNLRGNLKLDLNQNQDFLGSDPEFSDQNPERAPDSGFRSLQGNPSPDFFSFERVQRSGSESDHLVGPGSGPENDSDLVPNSPPPPSDSRSKRWRKFHLI